MKPSYLCQSIGVCGWCDLGVSTSSVVLNRPSNVTVEEQTFALGVGEDIGGLPISTVGVGWGEVEDLPNCCGIDGAVLSKSATSMPQVKYLPPCHKLLHLIVHRFTKFQGYFPISRQLLFLYLIHSPPIG